jgi:hypothetical protein
MYDGKKPEYFKKDAKLTAVNQMIEELGFKGNILNYLYLIIYNKMHFNDHMRRLSFLTQ